MTEILSNLPEAIILCGGKGERLRPITNDFPKPLVKICDKPILHYVISHLMQHGVNRIYIASGYKSDMIMKYIKSSNYGANIEIYNSGDVDIIKRIQDILVTVKNDILVLYGDTISNVDINDLVLSHRLSSKKVTMTVWPLKIAYGLVDILSDGTVDSFAEKPTLDKWINTGYFYINKNNYDLIFDNDAFEDFLQQSANNGSINAFKHPGDHITVNTLSDLEEAQKNIKNIITE